jgi:RNA polymerase sigma factor (sigma-70 family)
VRNNDFDIHLLRNDPNAFIEEHQKTITFIVNKFVASGFFNHGDRDEIIQFINEKLLAERIAKMQKQYKANYFVVTYLSKIIHNLCLEYSRKQRTSLREEISADISRLEIADNDSTVSNLLIEEESQRLDTILKMYHKHGKRIEVILKIFFAIGICREDLLQLYPNARERDINTVLNKCNPVSDLDAKTDRELYETVTQFINTYEKKQNTPDALRKWMNVKITEIIELLNGNPKTANYDKETLKILFQFRYKNLHFRVPK